MSPRRAATCTGCHAELEIHPQVQDGIISCPECGEEMEVVAVEPLLILAPVTKHPRIAQSQDAGPRGPSRRLGPADLTSEGWKNIIEEEKGCGPRTMAGCGMAVVALGGFGILIAMGLHWIDPNPTIFWITLGILCVFGIWVSFIERTDHSGKKTEIDWRKEGGPITRFLGYTLASFGWIAVIGVVVFVLALLVNIRSPHITTGSVIIVLLIILILQNASRN